MVEKLEILALVEEGGELGKLAELTRNSSIILTESCGMVSEVNAWSNAVMNSSIGAAATAVAIIRPKTASCMMKSLNSFRGLSEGRLGTAPYICFPYMSCRATPESLSMRGAVDR